MPELLLGCGNSRDKRIVPMGHTREWDGLVTVDIDPNCGADYIVDFTIPTLPFPDGHFDSVHLYDVLEHLGAQGDWRLFFAQFSELWRVLKPNGYVCATVPSVTSRWAWGDPGHTRVILPETLTFLNQDEYAKQVSVTRITDYRHVYKADFKPELMRDDGQDFSFILRAVK